jgi:hypothetical protein
MSRWSAEEYANFRGDKLERKIKRSKYGAKKTEIDGIRFDSKLEAKRYSILKIARDAGHLTFEMQVRYDLHVNGDHICFYKADFVVTYPAGRVVVEDCKGVKTPVYKLKKKMMKAIHGIEIVEITA